MQFLYKNRDLIAASFSAAVVVLVIFGGVRQPPPLKPKYDKPIALDLVTEPKPESAPQPPAPPTPPPPPSKAVVPPRPVPKASATRPVPQRSVAAVPAAPVAKPETRGNTAALPAPHTDETNVTQAPADSTPASADASTQNRASETARSQPASTVSAQTPRNDNTEASYISRLRAYLNSIKRYPSGRDASLMRPRGTVSVWFVIKRDGSLVDAGVETSSNSQLLDDAANKTVNRANFPPFPEQFDPQRPTHRFVVDLSFEPVG
jgi:periplasmic protein TonB